MGSLSLSFANMQFLVVFRIFPSTLFRQFLAQERMGFENGLSVKSSLG